MDISYYEEQPKHKTFHKEQTFQHYERILKRSHLKQKGELHFNDYKTDEDIKRDASKRVYRHKFRFANNELGLDYGLNFNKQDIIDILKEQGMKCACCGVSFYEVNYQIDHKQPVALGGSNSAKNIQMLCRSCNYKKGDMEYITWKTLVAYEDVLNWLQEISEEVDHA
jgi:hypothetical protein